MIQCAFAYKVIKDIAKAFNQDPSIDSFEIIPTPPVDKNTSPVLRGLRTIGLESWAVRHVLPFAHGTVLSTDFKKDIVKYMECLLAVNFLHPQMSTAWCKRKELILQGKLQVHDELRVTRVALSVVPKCNDTLSHRRWILTKKLVPNEETWNAELELLDELADRYPSNYHAWSHRQWCLRQIAPSPPSYLRDKLCDQDIPKNVMVSAFRSSSLPIYLKDLDSNFNFISQHVSDHSGLHHRTFLLNSIFKIMTSSFRHSQSGNDDSLHDNDALTFYLKLKNRILDFFRDAGDTEFSWYLSQVQSCLRISDVIFSLILEELDSNASQNLMFECHESLWCYRRFLVFSLFKFLNSFGTNSCLSNAYRSQLLVSEQNTVNLCVEKRGINFDREILQKHSNWLKRTVDIEIVIDDRVRSKRNDKSNKVS